MLNIKINFNIYSYQSQLKILLNFLFDFLYLKQYNNSILLIYCKLVYIARFFDKKIKLIQTIQVKGM